MMALAVAALGLYAGPGEGLAAMLDAAPLPLLPGLALELTAPLR